jgi:hypothetical protein
MVLPRIPHNLQKPHARILLLIVPCPRRVDEVLVRSIDAPTSDLREVRGDDLLGRIVELLAVLVEDEGVCIAVEDLKRQLRGIFVVDFRKGFGEDGP